MYHSSSFPFSLSLSLSLSLSFYFSLSISLFISLFLSLLPSLSLLTSISFSLSLSWPLSLSLSSTYSCRLLFLCELSISLTFFSSLAILALWFVQSTLPTVVLLAGRNTMSNYWSFRKCYLFVDLGAKLSLLSVFGTFIGHLFMWRCVCKTVFCVVLHLSVLLRYIAV